MALIAPFIAKTSTSTRPPASSPVARYAEMAGDLIGGLLLSQIAFWSMPGRDGKSKLRIKRDGSWWIAKTRLEWCRETGLSLRQYRRAYRILVDRRLIYSKVMKFAGQPMTHVRLVEGFWSKGPYPSVQKGPSTKALLTSSCTETTVSTYVQIKGATQNVAQLSKGEPVGANPCSTSGQTKGKLGHMPKGADILHGFHQNKKDPKSLGMFWKSRKSLEYPVSDLTKKEEGQLKRLQTLLTPETARQVVKLVIDDWVGFAHLTKAQFDLKSVPPVPDIGFVLKYRETALGLMAKMVEAAPIVQSIAQAETPQPECVPLTTVAPKPKPHVVSDAELAEILKELKE